MTWLTGFFLAYFIVKYNVYTTGLNTSFTTDMKFSPLRNICVKNKWQRMCSSCNFLVQDLSPVCNQINMTGATSGTGTAYPSWSTWVHPHILVGIRIAQSLVFCVLFCMLLFFLLSFSFRPLYCLSFFNLRFMITPLVSFHKTCNQTLHWSITLLKTTI